MGGVLVWFCRAFWHFVFVFVPFKRMEGGCGVRNCFFFFGPDEGRFLKCVGCGGCFVKVNWATDIAHFPFLVS